MIVDYGCRAGGSWDNWIRLVHPWGARPRGNGRQPEVTGPWFHAQAGGSRVIKRRGLTVQLPPRARVTGRGSSDPGLRPFPGPLGVAAGWRTSHRSVVAVAAAWPPRVAVGARSVTYVAAPASGDQSVEHFSEKPSTCVALVRPRGARGGGSKGSRRIRLDDHLGGIAAVPPANGARASTLFR